MLSYLASLLSRSAAAGGGGVEHSTMPASFYTSDAVFNFEKRAIFSRMWLLCCHERLLDEPGKYQLMNIAGQSFFVIRSKDGEIVRACTPSLALDDQEAHNAEAL
jgi:phenylpropionate dioxygenase-like ring-hydroxylating dioxygenase large terminal subunit